jgi:photosystem II stability/assembly factor-like uncharacterized protein
LYLSTNDGASWTKPANANFQTGYVSSIKNIGNNIFAGIKFTKGVQLSTDNGASWTPVNNGLTNLNINALEVNGSNFFAATAGGGVYLSSDNGASWAAVNNGLMNLNTTSLIRLNNNIFTGTQGGGIFVSTNTGTSWVPVNNNISNLNILTLYSNGSAIFAGAQSGDVYTSTNSGQDWILRREGMSGINILNLGGINNYIIAGTTTGIWRRSLTELTGVQSTVSELPDKFQLYQNYPNPFNPSTNIRYQITNNGNVSLKIYDIGGKEIKTLVNKFQNPGIYEVRFTGTQLSSGVYYYRLQAGAFTETKKMVIIK